MRTMLLCAMLLLGAGGDTLRVLFWNLENFFDWRADTTGVQDGAFTARGEKHWTRKRFDAKCQAVAKTFLWAGTAEGELPDVIGVAEVENAFVLKRLLQETALRKLDYKVVHADSPDPRGIDVALLYRRSRLRLHSWKSCPVLQPDSSILPTRAILLAVLETPDGTPTAFLVNHHPSKYGGAASSRKRELAVERLRQLADSLLAEGLDRIVAMGDFNDTPDAPLYGRLSPPLVNLAAPLARRGEGSIKFEGRWELIDQFFTTPACVGQMQILRIPFLQVPDRAHAGEKPLRTYSGPRYLGGASDHCPIWLLVPS